VTLEAEIEEMLGTSGLPTAWNRFSFRASRRNPPSNNLISYLWT
jgi:hypothetical protein